MILEALCVNYIYSQILLWKSKMPPSNPTKQFSILVPAPLRYLICTNLLQVCRKYTFLKVFITIAFSYIRCNFKAHFSRVKWTLNQSHMIKELLLYLWWKLVGNRSNLFNQLFSGEASAFYKKSFRQIDLYFWLRSCLTNVINPL